MGVPLLDCGNSMRVKIRVFHGLKNGDLVLLCHFTSLFIISECDMDSILIFNLDRIYRIIWTF